MALTVDITDELLAAMPQDPAAHELRVAAAALWYEKGLISQGRAANIAGLSRAEFMLALNRYGVSPFQETVEDLVGTSDRER